MRVLSTRAGVSQIVSTFVIAGGLVACSFSVPLSGPASAPVDAEVLVSNPDVADPSAELPRGECLNSCRARADNEYNLCRARTLGNESECAMLRDTIYAACPGECS